MLLKPCVFFLASDFEIDWTERASRARGFRRVGYLFAVYLESRARLALRHFRQSRNASSRARGVANLAAITCFCRILTALFAIPDVHFFLLAKGSVIASMCRLYSNSHLSQANSHLRCFFFAGRLSGITRRGGGNSRTERRPRGAERRRIRRAELR